MILKLTSIFTFFNIFPNNLNVSIAIGPHVFVNSSESVKYFVKRVPFYAKTFFHTEV